MSNMVRIGDILSKVGVAKSDNNRNLGKLKFSSIYKYGY